MSGEPSTNVSGGMGLHEARNDCVRVLSYNEKRDGRME